MKTTGATWHIERLNNITGQWKRLHPTLDGKPRIFKTRREAETFAYDNGHAGARNQHTRYVKDIAKRNPSKKRAKAKVKRAAPSWGIFAKRDGKKAPRMHLTGDRFTNNGAPDTFASSDAAMTKARALLAKFPVLKAYRVTVEKVKRKRNP